MYYIYKYQNIINKKIYVGQTNNITQRKRAHRSCAMNPNVHDYTSAFHNAIRKYGIENFLFEIIEKIDDSMGREYVNERERYYIKYYRSLVFENGYNITVGGDGCNIGSRNFTEKCACSKMFTEEQIRDIQSMLILNKQFFEIQDKYPNLTLSFLSNINTGINFKREDLKYPLLTFHSKYSNNQQEKIIQEIKQGKSYSTISEKYHISIGYLSQINNGKRWYRDNEVYPLNKKECLNKEWGYKCIYDILFSCLTYKQLCEKYACSISTIKAIASGKNWNNPKYKYSLRKYKQENQKIWQQLNSSDNIVTTISC